jgi:hypothetical protein
VNRVKRLLQMIRNAIGNISAVNSFRHHLLCDPIHYILSKDTTQVLFISKLLLMLMAKNRLVKW